MREQVCTNRHGAGPCPDPRCACVEGHITPHHDENGRRLRSTPDMPSADESEGSA